MKFRVKCSVQDAFFKLTNNSYGYLSMIFVNYRAQCRMLHMNGVQMSAVISQYINFLTHSIRLFIAFVCLFHSVPFDSGCHYCLSPSKTIGFFILIFPPSYWHQIYSWCGSVRGDQRVLLLRYIKSWPTSTLVLGQ